MFSVLAHAIYLVLYKCFLFLLRLAIVFSASVFCSCSGYLSCSLQVFSVLAQASYLVLQVFSVLVQASYLVLQVFSVLFQASYLVLCKCFLFLIRLSILFSASVFCSCSCYLSCSLQVISVLAQAVFLLCKCFFVLAQWMPVSREFEPQQKIPLFLCERNFTLIAEYWLVPGTDSSLIYISKHCWFNNQTKMN